ncbi:MAG: NAD(P)-dependent oxidoreductase [Pseudomonadota bacterium]|nr:NAD(P)-dependent oxidoreductase [Pseudomonadota bacterium]
MLITGATGFIGRHTLRELIDSGYEVHAIHNKNTPQTGVSEKLNWHQSDLLSPNVIPTLVASIRPTHLLHFGWYTEPGNYLESQRNSDWVRASIQLMSEFASNGGERFVAAGTCFEYDDRFGYCREDMTPLAPTSLYGHCKNSLRSILQAQAKNYKLPFAWGRIFFLYGPHEHPSRLVSSVIKSLLQGEQAKCSAGTQVRDFMHVADVAAGFTALLDGEVEGSVNICSGQAVTIRDVVSTMAEYLNSTELLRMGALPMRPNEPPLLVGKTDRLRNEVGFTPKFDLSTGLANTIEWWRSELQAQANGLY